MKKSSWLFLPLAGFTIVAFAAINAAPEPNHPLIGKWTWTRPENGCTETYHWRSNGTYFVVSGAERSEGVFKLSQKPDQAGFYTYTDKVLKDYGGKDCGDSEEDSTSQEGKTYIILDRTRDKILICFEPSMKKCFGPLHRVRDKSP